MPVRVVSGLGARADPELAEDIGDVGADGGAADIQRLGDLQIGAAGDEQAAVPPTRGASGRSAPVCRASRPERPADSGAATASASSMARSSGSDRPACQALAKASSPNPLRVSSMSPGSMSRAQAIGVNPVDSLSAAAAPKSWAARCRCPKASAMSAKASERLRDHPALIERNIERQALAVQLRRPFGLALSPQHMGEVGERHRLTGDVPRRAPDLQGFPEEWLGSGVVAPAIELVAQAVGAPRAPSVRGQPRERG